MKNLLELFAILDQFFEVIFYRKNKVYICFSASKFAIQWFGNIFLCMEYDFQNLIIKKQ